MFNALIMLLTLCPTAMAAPDISYGESKPLLSQIITRLDPLVKSGEAISLTQVSSIALHLDPNFNTNHSAELFMDIIQYYATDEEL